jgi:hypothetical protein
VTHLILMWMKHPGRGADRAQLKRAASSLRMFPGVLRVEVVPALPTGPDRSFDFGVVITFRDRAVLQRYEKDPRRREAMRRYLQPLVRRYEVYNFSSRWKGCAFYLQRSPRFFFFRSPLSRMKFRRRSVSAGMIPRVGWRRC